jgi:transcriptional regulator with XRE-family HTH domain
MRTLEELEDFVAKEARDEGPAAVADLQAQRERFRLAREIAEHRKGHKLTQVQLSLKSGIPQGEISKIESGANATEGTLLRMLQPLGLTLGIVPLRRATHGKSGLVVRPSRGQARRKAKAKR